jgi:hypothetical protein
MALYTYTLYLLRESARGSFVDDLRAAGLIQTIGDEIELLGLRCTSSITQAGALTVIELAPDGDTFERLLAERGADFVRWLWSSMERAGTLYAFIPGGGDVEYPGQALQWTQLPELIETGAIRVIHPLMMFATRLGRSRPCDKASALHWGLGEHRDGIGCLIGLASSTARGFELLEPGTTYPQLVQAWS